MQENQYVSLPLTPGGPTGPANLVKNCPKNCTINKIKIGTPKPNLKPKPTLLVLLLPSTLFRLVHLLVPAFQQVQKDLEDQQALAGNNPW